MGFNEIQLDYVDSLLLMEKNGQDLDYRNETGESKPGYSKLFKICQGTAIAKEGLYICRCIGLVGSVEDDMSLGQYWEAISNIVDYMSHDVSQPLC